MRPHLRAAVLATAVLAPITAWSIAAGPSAAQTGDRGKHAKPICATWQIRGATGAYPDVVFGGPPAGSKILNPRMVKLTKPAGVQPGVEFAAADLDVTVDKATTVRVEYTLAGGASYEAGAVRLFGYTAAGADTLNAKPDHGPDLAPAQSGVLAFELPAGASLGTLGLVYDASNSSAGHVIFRELRVGDRLVWFGRCPKPSPSSSAPFEGPSGGPSQEPSGEPSQEPTDPPSEEPSEQPSEQPSEEPSEEPSTIPPPPAPAGGDGGSFGGGGLALTGAPVALIGGGGVALVALGVAAFVVARRRRQFEG